MQSTLTVHPALQAGAPHPHPPLGPQVSSDRLRRLLREPMSSRVRLQLLQQADLSLSGKRRELTSELQRHLVRGRGRGIHPANRDVLKPLRTEAVTNWIRKTQSDSKDRKEAESSFTRVAGKRHSPHSRAARRDREAARSTPSFRSAYPPPGERAIAALARGTVLRPTPVRMSVAISTQAYSGPVKIPLCGDLRCRVRSCYTWPRMYSCFLSGELRKVGVEIDAVVHSGHPADLKDTNENASRPSVIRTSHSAKAREVIFLEAEDAATSHHLAPASPSPSPSLSPPALSIPQPASSTEADPIPITIPSLRTCTTISCPEGTLTLYRGSGSGSGTESGGRTVSGSCGPAVLTASNSTS